jgi:hypothetical protein
MLSLKCCKFSHSTFRVKIEAKMKVPNIYYLVNPSNKYAAVNKRPPPSSKLQTNPAAELCVVILQYSLNTISMTNIFSLTNHGPLKLRTVHFGDITIIYESKVSEQNIFPWLKGTIESRQHTEFQINCLFK